MWVHLSHRYSIIIGTHRYIVYWECECTYPYPSVESLPLITCQSSPSLHRFVLTENAENLVNRSSCFLRRIPLQLALGLRSSYRYRFPRVGFCRVVLTRLFGTPLFTWPNFCAVGRNRAYLTVSPLVYSDIERASMSWTENEKDAIRAGWVTLISPGAAAEWNK